MATLTYEEVLVWSAYRKRRGSLNAASQIEVGLARVMALMVNRSGGWQKGKPASPDDFLPRREALEEASSAVNIASIASAIGAVERKEK